MAPATRGRLLATLASCLLLASLATNAEAAQGQAPNQVGVRLVDTPVSRADDPRATNSVIDHLAPGAHIERRMDVVSTVASDLVVDVYATNAEVVDGVFQPTETPGGLASWVTVDQPRLPLPAQATERVLISVDVPDDAPPGEQYAVVWVEPPSADGQVAISNRVGIRLYLSIGEGGEPASDFTLGRVVAGRDSQGAPVVEASVTNTGGRAIDVLGALGLSEGPGGLAAGPIRADDVVTLAPAQQGVMRFSLDPSLPDGPWLVRIEARSGLIEKAAEATITFPTESASSAAPVESIAVAVYRDRGVMLPLAIGLFVVALGLVLAVWFLTRRRGDGAGDAPAERPPVEAGVG